MDRKSHRGPGVTDAHLRAALSRAHEQRSEEPAELSPGEKAARKVFKGAAAIAFTAGCLLWLATAGASHKLEDQIRLARQEGVPIAIEDLNPPAVPEAENAAPLFNQCFQILAPVSRHDFEETMRDFPWPLPAATIDRLDRCRPLLAEAIKRPYCRFGPVTLDNFKDQKPWSKCLFLCQMLQWSARWRLYRGDVRGSIEEWKLEAQVIRALHESGRQTLASNSNYEFWSRYLYQIKLAARQSGGNREFARGLLEAVDALGAFPAPRDQFRENVLFSRARIWAFDRSRRQANPSLGKLAYAGDDCGIDGCGEPGFTIYGISVINRNMDARAVEIGRLCYQNLPEDPENIVGLIKLQYALDDKLNSGDWLDSLYNSLVLNPDSATGAGSALALDRVLQVSLRIFSKGAPFPANLPDVGKIDVDPYTNHPLMYHRVKDGFVLYSVGPSSSFSDPSISHNTNPLSFQYPYVPPPKSVPQRVHRQIAPADDDDD